MDPMDAAYMTVHEYPGGAPALAPRLGMGSKVLCNKVRQTCDTHHFTLREADSLMGVTGDLRILHALASKHGGIFVESPEGEASDSALLELVAKIWAGHGDVGTEVSAALEDCRIESHEVERIRRAVYRTQMAMATLVMRLEGMV
ncbi:hypothetical protein LH427_01920 [Laribacter hongkongensis]|uniref:phage regulatory CII family protein n=1 Tax=Laribacter hongkongensis TaxID=168471 RepID=UPI001EFE229F|nr:phage regulatory CII family protein [Laribacter hongkongensis]MCG8991797.1 hypothetical protein [Laribacter hongkongensis]MCG8998722.1 hypothetical protein [Laribacter hongkongensis]MCG9000204.1 hypothetical protein [Laribacter hongkongensis]MCG9004439.1 hypothetical protein [Laribacter hongkongensis]MCG9006594.1 hypothetical protein [Laribacter hongkongensis]